MGVFIYWKGDEVLLGTLRDVVDGNVNTETLIRDIVADMTYQGDDETSVKIVIR